MDKNINDLYSKIYSIILIIFKMDEREEIIDEVAELKLQRARRR